MHLHPTRHRRLRPLVGTHAARRGSTLLLVIAILAILSLLAITLSFTSRLDIRAADNFGRGAQNREALVTGVGPVALQLATTRPSGPLGPLDLSLDPDFLARRPGPAGDPALAVALQKSIGSGTTAPDADALKGHSLAPIVRSTTAEVTIADTSARLNINTADMATLSRFFATIAQSSHVTLADSNALAQAIVDVRNGNDDTPGDKAAQATDSAQGSDLLPTLQALRAVPTTSALPREIPSVADLVAAIRTPEELRTPELDQARVQLLLSGKTGEATLPDFRSPPAGDDMVFRGTADLLRFPAITQAGMSRSLYTAAAPFMTAYSSSEEEFIIEGKAVEPLDINRATPVQIYERLRALYSSTPKNDRLLKQFAVNMADARDFDRVPTPYPGTAGADIILGVERTPFIVEVYPNSVSPDDEGDDGEYVQLYNPWPETFDLTGWAVVIDGYRFPLRGVLGSRCFLLLTDDENNESEDHGKETPGTGSLYDIFKAVGNTTTHRILAREDLLIPSDPGHPSVVSLFNADGQMLDSFGYQVTEDADSMQSFQRINPLLHETVRRQAHPFLINRDPDAPVDNTEDRLACYPPDGPFTSPAEAMLVFAGYSRSAGQRGQRWAFPVLATPGCRNADLAAKAGGEEFLDARLVDAFVVEAVRPGESEAKAAPQTVTEILEDRAGKVATAAGAKTASTKDKAEWDREARRAFRAPLPHGRLGLVNINTAPREVLGALPGLNAGLAAQLEERRARKIDAVRRGLADDGILFHCASEILADEELWNDFSDTERLLAFRLLMPRIALNSRSFLLVGRGLPEKSSPEASHRSACEVLVAIERGLPEYLSCRFVQ